MSVLQSPGGGFWTYLVIIAAFGLLGTWAGSGTNLPPGQGRRFFRDWEPYGTVRNRVKAAFGA